jgi:uncharacterized protein DUF6603
VSERGTLEIIAEHLGIAMQPLAEAVADVDSFVRFMGRIGWNVDSLPPQWGAVANAVRDVVLSVVALREAPSVGNAQQVLQAVRTLSEGVRGINEAPGGVEVAAFLADMHERLLEVLIVDYLRAELPTLAGIFRAAGVITEEFKEEAPGRPAFTETRFRFDELVAIAADPGSIPARIYGWGTPQLDFTLIAEHVSYILAAAGLVVVREDLLEEERAGLQGAADTLDRVNSMQLRYSIGEFEVLGQTRDVALALLEMPGGGGALPGLMLRPVLPTDIAVEQPLTESLKLQLRAGVDLGQPFGIYVRPGEVGVRYPFQPGTPPPSVGFGADLKYQPATPNVLLGKAGESRLEVAGVSFGIALDIIATPDVELQLKGDCSGLAVVLAVSEQDGFLGSLFGNTDLRVDVPLGFRWSNKRGFAFVGSAGLEVTVAPHLQIGFLTLDTVHLGALLNLSSGAPPSLDIVADVGLSAAIGPIQAAVEQIGVQLEVQAQRGNAGPFSVTVGLRGPSGIGAAIDAGPISGGGFLAFDRDAGRYAGILQLQIYEYGITAIGLLDTKLPGGASGYSFLIIIAVELPPIQLGYGFTLNGVGGLAGIHRTMITEAIQAGIRNHSVDHILFPEDPVQNAPQIISDLRTIFPPMQNRFVFGPMAIIGWGTPTLVFVELGILLELPAPIRLVLLGQVTVLVPTPDAPVLELHVDVLGILDFEGKKISIDAVIHDSRIVAFALYGDIAFRLSWGERPNFALSVGGLNPRFQPPPGFPDLRRITVSIGFEDNPRISVQGYFAITSNTLQFGALAELYAAKAGFNVHAWLGFDALLQVIPLWFVIDYNIGAALKRGGTSIASVRLHGDLSGPSPYHAKGKACISLLFFDVCVGFDVTFGSEDPAARPLVNPWDLLKAAIESAESWTSLLPSNALQVVTTARSADAPPLLIEPVGGARLRERVLPLNRDLNKFGEAVLAGPSRYAVSAVNVGTSSLPAWDASQDHFARAQFEALSDAEKLSAASFEPMDAGIEFDGDQIGVGGALAKDLTYETRIVDSAFAGRRGPVFPLPFTHQVAMLQLGSARRAAIRNTGSRRFAPDAAAVRGAMLEDDVYVIANIDDLALRIEFTRPTTKGQANAVLKKHLTAHPEDRDRLQVIAQHEAA